MAVAVADSGSQTATVSTEHTLSTLTTAGVYQPVVDVAAMVDASTADDVEFRVYGKARSGDTERLIYFASLRGAQSKGLWVGPAVISPHYMRLSLTQTAGTGRAFPWAVYST